MNGTLTSVPGILVGHAHDERALTGCTAILVSAGAVAGVDVSGPAPGTRETDLLSPTAMVERIHGICLAGGSVFGLEAAGGVVAFLEERGVGYDVRGWCVPIVPAAIIFDLGIGDGHVRPDRTMGYAAATAATDGPVAEGNVGAGCGASVAKLAGIDHAVKAGLGSASIAGPDGVTVAALAVVNALGSIVDPETGKRVAVPRVDGGALPADADLIAARERALVSVRGQNTTLLVVATNALLTKTGATRVARMAQDGLARAVVPAHLSGDGDVAFALSVGEHRASADLVGTLAEHAVARAIVRGVRSARAAGGLPSAFGA